MSRKLTPIVLVYILMLTLHEARAQAVDFDKLNGSPALLKETAVQQELKLSDDQIKKIGAIVSDYEKTLYPAVNAVLRKYQKMSPAERKATLDERTTAMHAARQPFLKEANSKLKTILSPAQMKRYKQIVLWYGLPWVWNFPDVESLLKLNEEQKAKIRRLLLDRATVENGFVEIRKKIQDRKVTDDQIRIIKKSNNEQVNRTVMSLLDEDQKSMSKEMLGEPFLAQ